MGKGKRRRGAGRGRKQKSATSIKTRSSSRELLQVSDESCSTSKSDSIAAVEDMKNGDNDASREQRKAAEDDSSTIKSGSRQNYLSSSAMTPSSPPEPRVAQDPSKRTKRSVSADAIQDKAASKTSLSTVKNSPGRKSRSLAATRSASTSTNADVNKVGTSWFGLTQAGEIQLKQERIPSVKTSTWNPFLLFPEEIWESIFNNLDSKDMENVINTTPEWRKMYQSKMVTTFFQRVLTILAKHDTYVQLKDYLPCRLVCSSWDQSVQNFIQCHPVHFDIILKGEDRMNEYGLIEQCIDQSWQEYSFYWYTVDEMQGFLDEMVKTHPSARNPFLTRQVALIDEEMGPYVHACCGGGEGPHGFQAPDIAVSQRWWSTVANVLEKYGRHIWDCNINAQWHLTPLTWYNKMQHWISLMQNLRVLDLEYFKKPHPIQPNELEDQIDVNPIPELKELIFLKTYDVPGAVFNELIQKSKKLQKLQINLSGGEAGTRLNHYQLNLLDIQNLTECHLTLVCPEDFTHLESTEGTWPLKKLYLRLEYENVKAKTCPRWPKWDRIFKMLEDKFATTLLDLKMSLPNATNGERRKKILTESLNYRLNLPHVTSLRVALPTLTSFDFLLPMKSLKELSILKDQLESELNGRNAKLLKKKEILKFTGNFNRLFKTNVWDELSNLNHVKLELATYAKTGVTYYYFEYDKKTMREITTLM